MSNKKYYTSTCGPNNGNFIRPLGYDHTRNIEEADVVIFGGGADIEPSTYGEEPADCTGAHPEREREERHDFRTAQELGIKSFGICRGFQLICALSGGKLIQDVSNHSGEHEMITYDGAKVVVNSIHHQMINPYNLDQSQYKILAWTERRSKRYIGARNKSVLLPHDFKEIETAYFPKTNSLGVQWHP